jgi:hypothetical protein
MSDDYEGCRLFVAPDGRSGFALQEKGKLAGYLWDFFVSPENERKAYDLLLLAIEQGGNKLVTQDHPLLTNFFELFGFQAVVMGRVETVVHMMLLDEVYRKQKSRLLEALKQLDIRNETNTSAAPNTTCASCRQDPQTITAPTAANLVGGYQCSRCAFIRIYGCLTLGPPEPA